MLEVYLNCVLLLFLDCHIGNVVSMWIHMSTWTDSVTLSIVYMSSTVFLMILNAHLHEALPLKETLLRGLLLTARPSVMMSRK